MRKRTVRKVRPVSAMISPEQHAEVVMMVHLYLDSFLNGTASIDQMQEIASFYNLGSVLANYHRDLAKQEQMHRALKIVARCVRDGADGVVAIPTDEERTDIRTSCTMLDRWIGIQSKYTLFKVCNYIDRALESRSGAVIDPAFSEINTLKDSHG